MNVEILINNSADPRARYLTWARSPCKIRLSDATGLSAPPQIEIRSNTAAGGGELRFSKANRKAQSKSLKLTLPLDGTSVSFSAAGRFGKPSATDGDVAIEVFVGATRLVSVPVMVRIRKDVTTLSAGERDRFIAAYAALNNRGTGRYADFRNVHTNAGSPEAHGEPAFLPWHRAYLVDLERELQAIDPSVALHYWRFDRPAPSLFAPEFMGASDSLGNVVFAAGNPLQFWTTDGRLGVTRRPLFNTSASPSDVINEADVLASGNDFATFRDMEGNPHGQAHVSFGGSISSIPTAAKDPLFFLLHANVDRLWAKWQRKVGRFDASAADSFAPGVFRVGHNLDDTMWPWNGVVTPPRPSTAPGGALANSPCVTAPGPTPQVRNCFDYQGAISSAAQMGFDYDDVRFA